MRRRLPVKLINNTTLNQIELQGQKQPSSKSVWMIKELKQGQAYLFFAI
jgi:hypothetical protein